VLDVALAVGATGAEEVDDVAEEKLVEFTAEMGNELVVEVEVALVDEEDDVDVRPGNVVTTTPFPFNTTPVWFRQHAGSLSQQ